MDPLKTLILDVDRSLASIGSNDYIARLMGYPPYPISGGIDHVTGVMAKLFTKKAVAYTHPLIGADTNAPTEEVWALTPIAEESGMQVLCLDSGTMMSQNERNIITNACDPNKRGYKVMDKQEWMIYGDRLGRFFKMMAKLPMSIVVTAHRDYEKDEATGRMIEVPGVKGANKYEMARHFDVVLYCHVVLKLDEKKLGAKPESEFLWQTKPDDFRPLAKDRLNLLPAIMEQDLGKVIRLYLEQGIQPKVLIIGDSGQGKTWCLRTINQGYEASQKLINKE